MANFAIAGCSGFVAPRHLRAIREVGGTVRAFLDPLGAPSNGLPDEARFFGSEGEFERHLLDLRAGPPARRVDFVSVCSPNDLHERHVRLAFRAGAAAVCEKPIVVDPRALDGLRAAEEESGRRVFTVLQLRLHPALLALRARLPSRPPRGRHEVALSFLTRRGPAYFDSWKGDEARSGGIAMNIGVHYFDLLLWLFGRAEGVEVRRRERGTLEGSLDLERARVRWILSVGSDGPPARRLAVDGEEVDFSSGLDDLHTAAYREILAGRGPGIEEARPSVELVDRIRRSP